MLISTVTLDGELSDFVGEETIVDLLSANLIDFQHLAFPNQLLPR